MNSKVVRDRLVVFGVGSEWMVTGVTGLRPHGLGLGFLYRLQKEFGFSEWEEGANYRVSRGEILRMTVHLVTNVTPVNKAYTALGMYFLDEGAVPPENVMIAHDELDVPRGKASFSDKEAGPGGHVGVQGLVTMLESKRPPRIKFGLKGSAMPDGLVPFLRDHELTGEELAEFDGAFAKAVEFLKAAIHSRMQNLEAERRMHQAVQAAQEWWADHLALIEAAIASVNHPQRRRKGIVPPAVAVLPEDQAKLLREAALALTDVCTEVFDHYRAALLIPGSHELVQVIDEHVPPYVVAMAREAGFRPANFVNWDFHAQAINGTTDVTLIEGNSTLGGLADAADLETAVFNAGILEATGLQAINPEGHEASVERRPRAIWLGEIEPRFRGSGGGLLVAVIGSVNGEPVQDEGVSDALVRHINANTKHRAVLIDANDVEIVTHTREAEPKEPDEQPETEEYQVVEYQGQRVALSYYHYDLHRPENRQRLAGTVLLEAMEARIIRILGWPLVYTGIAAMAEYCLLLLMGGVEDQMIAVVKRLAGKPIGSDGSNEMLVDYLRAQGYRTALCAAEDLVYDDPGRPTKVLLDDQPVRIVWLKTAMTPEDKQKALLATVIPEAVTKGLVLIQPSPAMKFFTHKGFMGLLYDPAWREVLGISEKMATFLDRVVAFTAMVTQRNALELRHLIRSGVGVALKYITGGGGRLSYILGGDSKSLGRLNAAVEAADSDNPAIVQGLARRFDLPGTPYEFDVRTIVFTRVDSDVFLFARIYKRGEDAVLGLAPILVLPEPEKAKKLLGLECPRCGQKFKADFGQELCPRCASICANCEQKIRKAFTCACEVAPVREQIKLVPIEED